jgi:hypothetical protein
MPNRKFEAVKFEHKSHMDLLAAWFNEREFPCPDSRYLPPTGYLIIGHGYPICAGFLFKTDAKIASISHLISDIGLDFELRSDALDFLLSKLTQEATMAGFEIVTCATNLDRLMGRFIKHGFKKTDENVSHFGRVYSCQQC